MSDDSTPRDGDQVETEATKILALGPADESEARRVLISMAQRRAGARLAEILADHVLYVTRAGDWEIQRAAMEAVLRRSGFGSRDRLRVASRPPRGRPFGVYATRRGGSEDRPYRSLLEGLSPIRGSCDCRDFVRNSLGLCKHILAILEDLASNAAKLRGALDAPPLAFENGAPRLSWDPIRPLTGLGDWLDRVRWTLDAAGDGLPGPLRKRFRSGADGTAVVRESHAADPAKRLDLVNELLAFVESSRRRAGVAEPALSALLREERARTSLAAAALRDRSGPRAALRSLRQKLYPYQLEGVERALSTGRLLLADDMGLGKTAQAIAVCHALRRAGTVERGLVIVPASLKPQWLREWQLFTDEPVEVVDGLAAERRRFYRRERPGFLIANYEQVMRDLDAMIAWDPGIVVLDEAQRIKNWATKTATYVKQLRPRYRLVLTGTPMENRIDELASLFDWIDDFALEPKWRLAPLHSITGDGRREVRGARHLSTLRERLAGRMLRRVRSEVLRQLPARTDTVVPIPITEAQAEEHDALNQPIAQLVAIARRRPLTQAQFLRLMSLLTTQRIIANGLAQHRFQGVWPGLSGVSRPDDALLQSLSTPKLLELREILAQIAVAQGRKVVIFSQWLRMLRLAHWAVTPLLADHGLRATFFTGEEGPRRRTRNLVEFHDDAATRVLFATDAGGVGLNLQHAASACVNLELPWNPAVLEQRIGRIYRLGQKRPIDVYNLVTQGSIEARIAEIVSDKRALFRGLFDGTSDEVRFEGSGSFAARLERLVDPVIVPESARAVSEPEPDADAPVEKEIEEMLEAADESGDERAAPVSEAGAAKSASAGDRAEEPPPPSAIEIERMFRGMSVRPAAGGGITIEAPREIAASLLAIFEGMTGLLRAMPRG